MSAFFQMGHHMENLVIEQDLAEFGGLVLSPVNRDSDELAADVLGYRKNVPKHTLLLDPQLYIPSAQRGKLSTHSYFPSDFDTADPSSLHWWRTLSKSLAEYVAKLGVDAVASPALLPRAWNDDYFSVCSDAAQMLAEASGKVETFMTVVCEPASLATLDDVLRVASIVTSPAVHGYYLVFVNETEPRKEISNDNDLFACMALVKLLGDSGRPVIVSNASSDMLLYKAAGAAHCATGKFFNLRRFTRSRYEDPTDGGGGQLPYWFSESLLAFLREGDVLRLQSKGFENLLGTDRSSNFWGKQILEHLLSTPKKAWVRLGWRQYLSWFGKMELHIADQHDKVKAVSDLLQNVDNSWVALDKAKLLMDERSNDGSWVRSWRQATNQFIKALDDKMI